MTEQDNQTETKKRPVGRPPLEMPEQIPDTPENIARAVLNTKPKKRDDWRFLKSHQESPQQTD